MSQPPWELVRGTEADLLAAQELTRRQYGTETLAHPDYWRWLTQSNPAGPVSPCLAKQNDEIIGQVMPLPVRVKAGVREVLAHILGNILVDRGARNQGVVSSLVPWANELGSSTRVMVS